MAEAEALRNEIRDLFERHRRGELRAKDFQKNTTLRTVELYRAVVSRRLVSLRRASASARDAWQAMLQASATSSEANWRGVIEQRMRHP